MPPGPIGPYRVRLAAASNPPIQAVRNPVDAVGVWYRELPYWRRLLLALLVLPIVVGWWLAYEFRSRLVRPSCRLTLAQRSGARL